jgi:nicotinamidase/pyrazinamidase
MKCLLITDLQNDFLPGGALAVENGDAIIPLINRLQQVFPLVVATQDWHPAEHYSFASNHPGKEVFQVIILNDIEQVLWPDHCVQASEGADFSPELDQKRIEAIFRKGTDIKIDSYSGFFDNNKLKSTCLSDFLLARDISQLYIAGLAADYCVGFTALDALDLGFDTYLIEDATRPINMQGFEKMKEKILKKGGKIITSESIL